MRRIGIIGAGISGLVTAKTFLEEGYEVAVFETESEVGGVWARSRRYPGMATQNPRDTYAFSDFAMPRSYPEFPTGAQVQAYLAAYADRYGVTPCVRFGTRVDEVRAEGDGWVMRTSPVDGAGGRREAHHVDYVVVANGVFNAPFIPRTPGLDEFRAAGGTVLHTSQVGDGEALRGKRVVVVGSAKSATDVAAAAANLGARTTMVFRRAGWKMPKKWFGMVPLRYVLTTRSAESLFRYRTLRGGERVLHTVGRPLVWAFWRGVEAMLRATQGLDRCGMRPGDPVEQFVGCTLSLETDGFFPMVHEGRIRPVRGTVREARPGAVELDTGETVEADVVVFGTGFRQEVPFLPADVRARIVDDAGVFHLYRNLVHPDVPILGFVGYNSSLYSQLTSEIGARWLAEHFRGDLKLPARDRMLREVRERLEWLHTERPRGTASGTCLIPFNFHYINDLLADMGARTRRAPLNPVREFLLPVDPSLYKDLKAELDLKRVAPAPAPRGIPARTTDTASAM
ncbi:MAG TPA: NAD(P)-binding domain-containing protein [Longimicrobiaceae bacterium]|jgi:cation diffusion facilitator CzcD-associated flavoprotein CzcO|nr:NAD(P)-binding domain-containing protein [Longimicrobiaceae bacterium]